MGVELAELGRMRSFDKPLRWTLPGGKSIHTADPEEALAAILAPFSLDSVITTIAGFTRNRETDRPGWTRRLADAGIHPGTFGPYLMRRLATAAIALRELPDTSTAQIGAHWLRAAFTCLMDVGAFADSKLDESPGTSARRMMQAQLPDQMNLNDYVRELALALESVELATSRGLAVDEAYANRYGLSFRCLVAFCFAAWATIVDESGTGVIDKATWLSRGVVNASAKEIEAFFSLCGSNFAELKANLGHPSVSVPGYDPYALSPLIRFPLVERGDGCFVAPIAGDLLVRPTDMFVGDTLDAVSTMGKQAAGEFGRAKGDVYESYVRRALETAMGEHRVLPAKEAVATPGKICDFLVDERRVLSLVEVKGIHFALKPSMTKDPEMLRTEYEKDGGLADGLIQIDETARAVRARCAGAIPHSRVLVGLLVVKGKELLLNTVESRGMLEDIVQRRSGHGVMVHYQVVNDIAFERLIAAASNGLDVGSYLHEKARNPGRRELDVDADLKGRAERVPDALFREHLARLHALWSEFFPGPIPALAQTVEDAPSQQA